MFDYQLDQAGFDALPEANREMYKQTGEGAYQLNVKGAPDLAGLLAQRDSLLDEKKTADRKRQEAEEAARIAAEEKARKEGDVAAIEQSWAKKLAELEEGYKGKLEGANSIVNSLLVDNTAQTLATSLAGEAAAVMLPHIKSRLTVDYADGKPFTRVLDATGKPSALTVEELGKEFAANKAFAGVIITSKASGTGGAGTPSNPANPGGFTSADRTSRALEILKQFGN